MNRFRTKKKAKDDIATSRPSLESEPSSLSFKFRRGKKSHEEEQKQGIDLANALPSNDDFRTSLLMTGLSARFSMLREQDDPNTKIGKASDDSVLFPKRQSRLLDYGFTAGLADIAEVESIRGPPSFSRMDSFVSDDAVSTKGSLINRPKPTEGNNLFGGRQKIYKIPLGTSSSKNVPGRMGGRALYEDDVAMSSFQRWRQQEKEAIAPGNDTRNASSEDSMQDAKGTGSESSAPPDYNRKRETSSTTSSTPSLTRNSTAATSVTSQPSVSLKDWQSQAPAAASNTSSPVPERTVTRTRRLYEQGLTQELHERQSSALSRLDTLSRQRNFGSRTPDPVQHSPSPTATQSFGERFGAERAPMLSKASAPNLRSMSPPASSLSAAVTDLGIKVPVSNSKISFAGSPPLSPPLSETSDHALFPIQSKDRGKATAMGVFQKPVQPYDESRYAQRQLQLQQGRETPTQRFRSDSNASFRTGRSHSSSSSERQQLGVGPADKMTMNVLGPEEERTTFLDDSDDSADPRDSTTLMISPKPTQRPPDQDHPALRRRSMPMPPLLSEEANGEGPSTSLERPDLILSSPHHPSPDDSPTLGPTEPSSGLSGMVRQHLRSESNASSVYDRPPLTSGPEGRFPVDRGDSSLMRELGVRSDPWQEHEWRLSHDSPDDHRDKRSRALSQVEEDSTAAKAFPVGDRPEEEDFAHQLADAQRRVREKLTSYVESDRSRSVSPRRLADYSMDVTPANRSNGLTALTSKGNRGSLVERRRDMSQSKSLKLLGIGSSTMSSSPSPSKQMFDDRELELVYPGTEGLQPPAGYAKVEEDVDADSDVKSLGPRDDENIHPGLRAFRQARRELQKRKELETIMRHQPAFTPGAISVQEQTSPRPGNVVSGQRTPSTEHKLPPILYPTTASYEEDILAVRDRGSESRIETERGRIDVEGDINPARPFAARSTDDATVYDDHQHLGRSGTARLPMLRSPGLPGTDIRRSPIMPPQRYAQGGSKSGTPSPNHFAMSPSATLRPGNLAYDDLSVTRLRSTSPVGGLGVPSPSLNIANILNKTSTSVTTPNLPASTRPPSVQRPLLPGTTNRVQNDSLRRFVRKDDISEPTFVTASSTVPTMDISETSNWPGPESSSRLGSSPAYIPPPLPPINPRRKEGSRVRAVFGTFVDRGGGEVEDPSSNAGNVDFPSDGRLNNAKMLDAEDDTGASSVSDDEDGRSARRRLRKGTSESKGMMNARAATVAYRKDSAYNQPFIAAGPPASRSVITSSIKGSPTVGGPGGMI